MNFNGSANFVFLKIFLLLHKKKQEKFIFDFKEFILRDFQFYSSKCKEKQGQSNVNSVRDHDGWILNIGCPIFSFPPPPPAPAKCYNNILYSNSLDAYIHIYKTN